ncbi:MAG: DNA polymerase I, partial [Zetaproteobacteria bacterium]
YRAFFAQRRPLHAPDGTPTQAVFGFAQMLHKALLDEAPTHWLAAFDPIGPTIRNQWHPDYKAHRPPPPEDLERQWPLVFELLDALNVPYLQMEDYEADDLIATYVRMAREKGWPVVILSTDKDLMQLVDGNTVLLDTMKEVRYTPEEVERRWGVPPRLVGDLLALMGDSSDNIPGVPGIGPKTAASLLRQFGSLDAVLSRAHEIPQAKRREQILAHAEDVRLARRLVQLIDEAPVPYRLEDLERRPLDRAKFEAFCDRLALRSVRRLFLEALAPPKEEAAAAEVEVADRPIRAHLARTRAELKALAERLQQAELVAFDTETDSLAAHRARLVGLSFAVGEGEGWYVPVAHEGVANADWGDVRALIAPVLEDASVKKCGHHLKYDLQVLWRAGIRPRGLAADSMLLAYVLRPGDSVRLDDLAERYL